MKYSYEISPRPVEFRGGWRLRMLEDGQEVGGGVFPVAENPDAGPSWWNACSEQERGQAVAKSAVPADAWQRTNWPRRAPTRKKPPMTGLIPERAHEREEVSGHG
jgi:hypothetical protein